MTEPDFKIRLSASQVKQFESCERQWFYERVKRIEVKKSYAQGLGTEVHELAERWLLEAKVPPDTKAGQILRAGLSYLPAPKTPNMEIEQRFEFDVRPDISVVGFMDVRVRGVGVWDLKTSGDIDRYSLTAPQLLEDIQAQLYAYVEGGEDQRAVPVSWVYFATKGASRAKAVPNVMPFDKALEGVDRVLRAGDKIIPLKLAPETDAADVPGNFKHCDSYGGCPHRAYCPIRATTFADMFGTSFSSNETLGDTMGLKDKLKAALASTTEAVEAPAAVDKTTVTSVASEVLSAPPAVGVNAPDAQLSPDDEPEVAAPTTTEPPKRKRRTKAEMEAAKASQMIDYDQAPAEFVPSAVQTNPPAGGTIVYVDCYPIKSLIAVLPADILIAKAAAALKAKHGLEDYRLADYGKGAPLLLLEFGKLYDTLPKPVSLTVNSRTPEGAVVLSFLTDRADEVVKGV